jgi:hypothetical protein
MQTVCQHCNEVLRDDGKGDNNLSHGDCLGYKDRPCKKGEIYYRELAVHFDATYEEVLQMVNP